MSRVSDLRQLINSNLDHLNLTRIKFSDSITPTATVFYPSGVVSKVWLNHLLNLLPSSILDADSSLRIADSFFHGAEQHEINMTDYFLGACLSKRHYSISKCCIKFTMYNIVSRYTDKMIFENAMVIFDDRSRPVATFKSIQEFRYVIGKYSWSLDELLRRPYQLDEIINLSQIDITTLDDLEIIRNNYFVSIYSTQSDFNLTDHCCDPNYLDF